MGRGCEKSLSGKYFSFTWHPYAVDEAVDYSKELPTLVEFTLEPKGTGTRLTVVELGSINSRRIAGSKPSRMDTEGWIEQMENIAKYVD